MSGEFHLSCPECDEPVFARDVNLFGDGETELCESCGTTVAVSLDAETPASVDVVEEPIAEIRRLRAALGREQNRRDWWKDMSVQQQDLREAAEAERDAAIARAEQAERERDEWSSREHAAVNRKVVEEGRLLQAERRCKVLAAIVLRIAEGHVLDPVGHASIMADSLGLRAEQVSGAPTPEGDDGDDDDRCEHYDGSTPCEHHPAPWRADKVSDDVWHIYDADGEFVREVFGDDAEEYATRLATESAPTPGEGPAEPTTPRVRVIEPPTSVFHAGQWWRNGGPSNDACTHFRLYQDGGRELDVTKDEAIAGARLARELGAIGCTPGEGSGDHG